MSTITAPRAAPIVSFKYEFGIGSDTLSGVLHPDLNFSGTVTFDLATPDLAPASPTIGFYAIDSHVISLNGAPLTGGVLNTQGWSKNQIDVYFFSQFGSPDFVDFFSTVNAPIGTASLWAIGLRFDNANPNFTGKSLFLPDPSNFGNLMATLYYDTGVGGYSLATSFRISSDDASVVPIPAALPLFASGVAVIGLLGWSRKRKTTAKIVT
jgi:hypothetical protein